MDFSSKANKDILNIAEPIMTNIIEGSNENDYEKFSKEFSSIMLKAIPKEEFERQMAESSEKSEDIKNEREFLSCIFRDSGVTVLWKASYENKKGEVLAQLTLDEEDGKIKVFGAFIG
ncbi:hypothetical protein [Desulfobacter curvatus]|uniref:hypothetical protein n=1 Tax=Desulfobacter curvatus TaxID=2290 RepID=UPI0012F9A07F|nr:hypothetical protein [Desulfobacter curvatus]